jgi:hypothetical protein
VKVMYVSEDDDLLLTTMCWPLTHVRLKGCCLLLEIIQLCFKNAISEICDDGLNKVRKNPYRYNF